MKNLITTLLIAILTSTVALSNTTPEVLISEFDFEVVSVGALEIFVSAEFDAQSENLIFDTNKSMTVVQIFNEDGDLEFQLPVMSNNVQINKNLFDKGSYKLGFVIEGDAGVHFTTVNIK